MDLTKRGWFILKLIVLICLVILSFGLEFLYREPLFDKSLKIQKNLYESTASSTIKFFKYFTYFGTQAVIDPLFFIVFLCFPLTVSYTFLNIIVFAYFIVNFLKIGYSSPRPYWINPEITRSCDGAFGNPSGHSFSSFSVYLSLWNILTDSQFFRKNISGKTLKVVFFILFLAFCITIIISRIYLSVHSINQILHGSLLGIFLYYFYFHVIRLHKYTPQEFYKFICSRKMILAHTIMFVILFLSLLLMYFLRQNDTDYYDIILSQLCPKLKEYKKFNNDGLFQGLFLFLLVGAYYGLLLLFRLTNLKFPNKVREVINWNKGTFCSFIYRLLFIVPFSIPMVLIIAISGNANLTIIYIFKAAFPFATTMFLYFGLYIYSAICCKICNESLYLIDVVGIEGDSGYIKPGKGPNDIAIEVQVIPNQNSAGPLQ